MNILHVIASIAKRTGGPAKAVLELSETLAQRGHTVKVLSTDYGLEREEKSGSAQANAFKIQLFKCQIPGRFCYAPGLKQELERSVRSFDLVHIHGLWVYPTLAASRACRRAEIPYLIRPCGMLDAYCLSHHPIRKLIYGFLFERSDLNSASRIHFTSEEERERSEQFGFQAKSVIVPIGIRIPETTLLPPQASFRKQNPKLEGKKIILFLGRLSFKKGLDLLVRAFAETLPRFRDTHLVIAGPDDEGYGKKLEHWIRQRRIEDHVTVLGFVEGERKLALLRESDIFCLPSDQENFGLAVLEAMAEGLPVVVSDQVNLWRQIQTAEAGIVTACRVEALKEVFERLLSGDGLCVQMGQNGKRLVQEKYRWDVAVEKIEDLYQEVAGLGIRDRTRARPTPAKIANIGSRNDR